MRTVSISAGDDGVLQVVLRGEIDFTNAGQLSDAVRTATRRSRPTAVRVDMADVTFLDSSGIGALVVASRAAEEVEATFRVERVQPNVFDQLRLAGLLEMFGVGEPSPGQ